MTTDILNYIQQTLSNNGINYAFMRYDGKVTYPYWVGEYDEIEVTDEDSYHEYNFRLTGTTRKSWLELEQNKQRIEELLSTATTLSNDTGVAFSYTGSLLLPTGEADLKRMQINLRIQEWRVK